MDVNLRKKIKFEIAGMIKDYESKILKGVVAAGYMHNGTFFLTKGAIKNWLELADTSFEDVELPSKGRYLNIADDIIREADGILQNDSYDAGYSDGVEDAKGLRDTNTLGK